MKVFAIASAGGHWVQLLRLKPFFQQNDTTFVCTNSSFSQTVKEYKFYSVPDATRWNKLKLLYSGYKVARLIFSQKPDLIITTGAAPGLMGIIAGRLRGSKTIWIDSIANVERISMSGRIAKLFASRVYTQWEHLAGPKIVYNGNVLS